MISDLVTAEEFVLESPIQISLNILPIPTDRMPPPVIAAEFIYERATPLDVQDKKLQTFDSDHIHFNKCTPVLQFNVGIFFLKIADIKELELNYFITGTTLNLKFVCNSSAYADPSSWLIKGTYRNPDIVRNIKSVFAQIHDKDPDTSRGTTTIVQH